jgi:ADP-ribose pyrophosphatase YjhB (NUDIX family)
MKLPKRFNNRENDHIVITTTNPETGKKSKKEFWNGRSNALVGIVFAQTNSGTKVLITKRSKLMPNAPEQICLPCGFLDWDESLHQGMMREVYEETSFNMVDNEEYLIYNNDKKPILVLDDPGIKGQNISHIFISVFDFTYEMGAFPHNIEEFTCDEVAWVKWLSMDSFFKTQNSIVWAYEHNKKIIYGWNHWNNLPYNTK